MRASELIQKLSESMKESGIDFIVVKTYETVLDGKTAIVNQRIVDVVPVMRCGTPVVEL